MGITLPQELCDRVITFSDGSWKSLRFVCKAFDIEATKHLFAELTVCLQVRSLQRLVYFAKSKKLGKHVRAIFIGEEDIPLLHLTPSKFIHGMMHVHLGKPITKVLPNTNSTAYRESYFTHREYQTIVSVDNFCTAEKYPQQLEYIMDRNKAFGLYREHGDLVYEQAVLMASDRDAKYLATAFSNLKNLSEVHIVHNLQTESHRIRKSWGAILPSVYRPPDYYPRAMAPPDRRLDVFIRACTASQNMTASKLVIDDERGWSATHGHEVRTFSSAKLEHIISVLPSLAHVTHLNIPIGTFHSGLGHDYELDFRPFKTAKLVEGLPFLQHFTLHHNGPRSERFKVSRILTAIRPGYLKVLNLECCVYKAPVLEKFMLDHRATLRHLSMDRTFLLGGKLKSIFIFMREQLNLETLTLTSFQVEIKTSNTLWKEELETTRDPIRDIARSAVADFVLHRTDVFPSEMMDEDATFTTSKMTDVVQFIGRADFAEHDFEDWDETSAGVFNSIYPDSDADSVNDDDHNTTGQVESWENYAGLYNDELCRALLSFGLDNTIHGEAELDAELLRVSQGNNRIAEDMKYLYRSYGWML